MIKEWIQEYSPRNLDDAENALREIMQEVALAGLQRSGFFEKATFYGGTALRIFHKLNRFSEDLDFSLLEKNPNFSLQSYLQGIIKEFEGLGMQVEVKAKKKTKQSNIDSAFLKPETEWKEIILGDIISEKLSFKPSVKIKLEIDTEPPPGFETEEKLLLKPFSFYVKCFTLPDLFAGKMHALLFRKWQQRVKGRDWYDMEWYIKKGVELNLQHFKERAVDSGDWDKDTITEKQFMDLLHKKIESVSFDNIREDIMRFIPDTSVLDIWSEQYFNDLADHLKFKQRP